MSADNPWDAQAYGAPQQSPQQNYGPAPGFGQPQQVPQQAPVQPQPQGEPQPAFGPPQQQYQQQHPQQQYPQQFQQPLPLPQPQYPQYQQQPNYGPPQQQQFQQGFAPDGWSVPQQQQHQQYQQQWQGEPGRGMRVAALILLIVAVVMTIGSETALVGLGSLAGNVATLILIVGLGIAGGAMLDRRARNWSAGLAVGLAITEAPIYIQQLRSGDQIWYQFWSVGALLATALGGLFAFVALQQERAVAEPGIKIPMPAVALAIPAVLFWAVSDVLNNFTWKYTDSSGSFACCSWSHQSGQDKIANVLTILALAVVVLYAAQATRAGLAKGLLAGAFVFMASQAAGTVFAVLAPGSTISNLHGMTDVHASIDNGFWFTLVGLILFAAAFITQRSDPRERQGATR
ncbi:hypothetical protein [Actinospica sp.]|uniref:hypothetical protein n=1 Tax=Actinospica sp. TaxID=1872142 RepID=UPI002B9E4F93|nr:hypothetical protein [Actinospica sp.]HWG25010.1 hypothetical protein [Actinospica sp.]